MATDRELEALKKRLRSKLRDASGDIGIAAADLQRVLDELGRLMQSNDRLRRQNRRVRLKLQRAGIADDVEVDGGGDDDAGDGAP
ncbi:MAG: hypothetical protein JNK15_18875 [Planctomycetes bacterium]|nr:hypothetical protein [Planctomycetota bacterium]